MFKIEMFVEDKNLPKLLWAVDGVIAEPPQIVPVRGATTSGHGKVIPTNGYGTIKDRVLSKLAMHGGNITWAAIRSIYVGEGGTAASAGSMIDSLVKVGALRKLSVGEYQVMHAPAVQAGSGGPLMAKFQQAIENWTGPTITSEQGRLLLKGIGGSPTSAGPYMSTLTKNGFLTRTGKGLYSINN